MFTKTKMAAKYGVAPSPPGTTFALRETSVASSNEGAPRNRIHPSPIAYTAREPTRTRAGRPKVGGPSLARASFRRHSQTKYRYWIECKAGIAYTMRGSTQE